MMPRGLLVAGATGGIGSAVCTAAGAADWHVYVAYHRSRGRAERLARGIVDAGGSAAALPLTLPSADALGALSPESPAIEALVLAATPALAIASFTKTTPASLREHFEVGAVGAHQLIAECWRRYFRPAGHGHVVALLTSALGPPPAPHLSAYLASKAALLSLLRSACVELGPAGFSATALHPGFTETPLLAAFDARLLEQARTRQGGFLDPGTVAGHVVEALASPPAAGVLHEITLGSERT